MTSERSMIGRRVSANGTDHGDGAFIKKDMGFDAATEEEALKTITTDSANLSLAQVEQLVRRSPSIRKAAYTQLLTLYPSDPRAVEWREQSK